MTLLRAVCLFLGGLRVSRAALLAENLLRRQQTSALQRSGQQPRCRSGDRIFWVWLSRVWTGWRSALLLARPQTVAKWHRQGLKLYGCWKSRRKTPGRPKIDAQLRGLSLRVFPRKSPFPRGRRSQLSWSMVSEVAPAGGRPSPVSGIAAGTDRRAAGE